MAKTSDVVGALFVGVLFFGSIAFWVIGRRKLNQKLSEQGEKLKSRGLEISPSGMKVRTNLDISEQELIQRASHKVQTVKDRIINTPEVVQFGKKRSF